MNSCWWLDTSWIWCTKKFLFGLGIVNLVYKLFVHTFYVHFSLHLFFFYFLDLLFLNQFTSLVVSLAPPSFTTSSNPPHPVYLPQSSSQSYPSPTLPHNHIPPPPPHPPTSPLFQSPHYPTSPHVYPFFTWAR